jgi:oxygen-dependent protoporphyrinogen oxidase
MKRCPKVVIIGGGISGLATAWWLHKSSIDVQVLEQGKHPGGTMQTVRTKEWLVETGPNSALETTPLFKRMFQDLGITDQVLYASEAGNNRYILRNGTLHALPMTTPAFFRSRLWTIYGKLRLLKEPFVRRADHEETIADFVERRLGKEFLDYAINPFVSGVYAGNPEQLSVRAAFPKLYALEDKYGGLIRGQIMGARERKKRAERAKDRARMFSFKNGMQTFPDAIAAALSKRVLTGSTVKKLIPKRMGKTVRYIVSGTKNGRPFECDADAVLTAIPSYAMAKLVEPLDRILADSLKNIYYPPVAEVSLGFKLLDIARPLDGFGFLVPAKEQRRILGTIWSSSLFPGRSPSGHALLTTFVGGSHQPQLTEEDDDRITSIVVEELSSIMGVKGNPVFKKIFRWPRAIPQYNLGHLSIIGDIESFEQRHPGLFLSGNYRGGISVGDCIMSSEKMARLVMGYLNSQLIAA